MLTGALFQVILPQQIRREGVVRIAGEHVSQEGLGFCFASKAKKRLMAGARRPSLPPEKAPPSPWISLTSNFKDPLNMEDYGRPTPSCDTATTIIMPSVRARS